MNSCSTYPWCELDHSDPELADFPGIHEKRRTLTVGDVEQDFSLEVGMDGVPRLEAALGGFEVFLEPNDRVNSLRNLSQLYRRMADAYDDFLREVAESNLRRARSVDDAVASEVRTLIADRGWTYKEAADAFGLPASRVGNLLNRQTRWSVADLLAVARSTGNDEDDEIERLLSIARGAMAA